MKVARLAPLDGTAPTPPTWEQDKADVLGYLNGGRLVTAARMLEDDALDPSRRREVPVMLFTDGEWIWSGAMIYYAENHDIPIDAELIEYAREHSFEIAEVSDDDVRAALQTLRDLSSDRDA